MSRKNSARFPSAILSRHSDEHRHVWRAGRSEQSNRLGQFARRIIGTNWSKMNLVISIFLAAIVGALATAFAGTLFCVLEQKSPLLGNDVKIKKSFRRMMFCVWVTSALLCIVLMYQCSP